MHSLILGETLSGKSTLMRWLARRHTLRGDGVIVHDKHLEDWGQDRFPGRVFVTHENERFLSWVRESRSCALFVDEARHMCGRDRPDERFIALATESRHRGHAAHFCAQNVTAIHFEIRANCPRVFIFHLQAQEAKKTAQLLGRPEVEAWAPTLAVGEFLHVFPMRETRRMRLP